MNFSRQALLGTGMIIGGSVMLYAMVNQVNTHNPPPTEPAIVEPAAAQTNAPKPLTTDVETEKRLLAQKQKERAARVAEQEKRAQLFLEEQEEAEAQALAKSRAENQQYVENSASIGGESDSPEAAAQEETAEKTDESSKEPELAKPIVPEASQIEENKQDAKKAAEEKKAEAKRAAEAAEKAKQEKEQAAKKVEPAPKDGYKVQSGDVLGKIARRYGVSVAALAQANDMSPSDALKAGKTIVIPTPSETKALERKAAAAKKEQEAERKKEKEKALAQKSEDAKLEAQKKLSEARKEVKETDAKGSFGVQVALATSQNAADDVVKKFEAAGYKVKTSRTSRGVRVVVGPERGKVAALALKDKINSDPAVKTTSAWVLYW